MAPTDSHPTDTRTAELWVRSHSPFGAAPERATVLDSLETLEEAGYFDDVAARLWGKRVGLSTMAARTEEGTEILDRVTDFRTWAERNDATIDQFFEKRMMDSQLVNESYLVQELPTLALAEYENGEVVHVAPCIIDGTLQTVEDRVATIEADAEGEIAQRELAPASVR
ncbi:HTH domain-containing protein [Haloarchaeobius amylolyticus]|uniref:HTH domain-containing protein n=1 Tax=Haloarchaeobius amylolyticus TaxID=1198296 RepID=UPI0022720E1A|nr:HTH domain-containing protein [Haloarchaeobius amylolyticus]